VGASFVAVLLIRLPDSFQLLGLDHGAKLVLTYLRLRSAATVLVLRLGISFPSISN
jgi:hypothetical protein